MRRGHVAPQNTFLDTIIRKFEGQSKCEVWGCGGLSAVRVGWQEQPNSSLTSDGVKEMAGLGAGGGGRF